MSARDVIMAKVAKSLGVGSQGGKQREARRAAALAHIETRTRHPLPARVAGKGHDELVTLFRQQLETSSATVQHVASMEAVPQAVADYLRANNLPQRVRVGGDDVLAAVPWRSVATLEVGHGRAELSDEVGISRPIAGVAETGTLVLASGADNPVTLNFVPETHIVVLEAANVVGPYEDAWIKLRERFGAGTMPRTVNMISGPSRTGDIGGRIVMGAHGPRRMCVILVGA